MNKKDPTAVLIAAAECAPFAKKGGLADVVGALPKYLKRLGFEARVIMPYHRVIKDKYASRVEHMRSFSVDLGWRSHYVGLEKLVFNRMTVYLIDNEYFFNDAVYRGGDSEGEQYAFFTRAVLEALPLLDFTPRLIHANDWHTAMIPMLLKTQYQGKPQGALKTLLTIHNLAYQGRFGFFFVKDLLGVDNAWLTPEFMESFGAADFLKAGCVFADKINTVSPTYAEEIVTPRFGEGLEGVLNARAADLSGIINGIDRKVYSPATDRTLPARYHPEDLSGKLVCKQALLLELGLKTPDTTPLIAMVSRLTAQKGLDLIACVLDEIMRENVALAFLGTGEQKYESLLREAERRYRGRVCSYIAYNEELAHRMYAGSDFLLMPSLFEPCGLAQMIAMRYGSLPIVRETGGLKDTVRPYNQYDGSGTGFSFANYNAHEMLDAIRRALVVYHRNQPALSKLIRAAMESDFGFERPAKAYADLYRQLIN